MFWQYEKNSHQQEKNGSKKILTTRHNKNSSCGKRIKKKQNHLSSILCKKVHIVFTNHNDYFRIVFKITRLDFYNTGYLLINFYRFILK